MQQKMKKSVAAMILASILLAWSAINFVGAAFDIQEKLVSGRTSLDKAFWIFLIALAAWLVCLRILKVSRQRRETERTIQRHRKERAERKAEKFRHETSFIDPRDF